MTGLRTRRPRRRGWMRCYAGATRPSTGTGSTWPDWIRASVMDIRKSAGMFFAGPSSRLR